MVGKMHAAVSAVVFGLLGWAVFAGVAWAFLSAPDVAIRLLVSGCLLGCAVKMVADSHRERSAVVLSWCVAAALVLVVVMVMGG